MSESSTIAKVSVGPSVTIPLVLILTALKLDGAINWDWIWIFSPAWIPALVGFFVVGAVVTFLGAAKLVDLIRGR